MPPGPSTETEHKHAAVADTIERLRTEAVLRYDPSEHKLAELAAALLECQVGECLTEVHQRPDPLPTRPPLCPTLHHAYRLGGRKVPGKWRSVMGPHRNKKVLQRLWASSEYQNWLTAYDAWVAAVVLPAVGQSIYYQRPPTLRVAMPSHAATIGVHCDADYPNHHLAEINFWCPLTPVSGSSALHLETAPGRGDFRPLALVPGEVLRFNGSLCRHHTVPNITGRTRVSFDLRCIPASAVDTSRGPPQRIGDYTCCFMEAVQKETNMTGEAAQNAITGDGEAAQNKTTGIVEAVQHKTSGDGEATKKKTIGEVEAMQINTSGAVAAAQGEAGTGDGGSGAAGREGPPRAALSSAPIPASLLGR